LYEGKLQIVITAEPVDTNLGVYTELKSFMYFQCQTKYVWFIFLKMEEMDYILIRIAPCSGKPCLGLFFAK
jgi:hypothetical protein